MAQERSLTIVRSEPLTVTSSQPLTVQRSEPLPAGYLRRGFDVAKDVGVGVMKGAANTAIGLGEMVHQVPGVTTAVDALYGQPGVSEAAFPEARAAVQPTNTAQRIGYGAEQIGEVILPGGAIRRAATAATTRAAPTLARFMGRRSAQTLPAAAVESASAAGIAGAQGGDPTTAAIGGAVVPIAGSMVRSAAPALRAAAQKKVVQALGPTKERFKAMAERIAPGILRRGLRGSREQLQAQAAEIAETAGQQVDDAIRQYGARATGTQPILDALERAKDAFRTVTQAGKVVVYEPRSVAQLEGLQRIISDLGPRATVAQLVAIRQGWDKVVAQAGGFAHRAPGSIGVPLKDQSEAWAKREATAAIRKLLNTEVPELGAINAEYSFWKSLDDVLTMTLQRTQAQGPGLIRQTAEAAGQVGGAVVFAPSGPASAVGGAFVFGKMAKMAQQVFTSPRWRFATAKMKDRLAAAIESGNVSRIAMALVRVGAVQGSKTASAAR
jgi:hypothetical protein